MFYYCIIIIVYLVFLKYLKYYKSNFCYARLCIITIVVETIRPVAAQRMSK